MSFLGDDRIPYVDSEDGNSLNSSSSLLSPYSSDWNSTTPSVVVSHADSSINRTSSQFTASIGDLKPLQLRASIDRLRVGNESSGSVRYKLMNDTLAVPDTPIGRRRAGRRDRSVSATMRMTVEEKDAMEDDELALLDKNEAEKGHSLGEKRIGIFSSFVYIVNQIYGPGVVAIPIVFQEAGLVVTVAAMFFFLVLSSFASTLLCAAIAKVPGNHGFDLRIEYSTAVRHYFGRVAHFIFQIFLNVTLQSFNISSIIICAQSMDNLIRFAAGQTAALELYPHPSFLITSNMDRLYDSTGTLDITAGYLVVLLVTLPMGFWNLDDNIKIQWASFIGLVVLMVEFAVAFFIKGIDTSAVPIAGDNYAQVVSVFIISWGYVMLIPSWVNEKKDHVGVNSQIWVSGVVSFMGYFVVGLLAAWTYPNMKTDDLLGRMSSSHPDPVTQVCVYLFSIFIILPGIPVFSITTRYNLLVGGICGKKMSYVWGVVAPWMVGFIFTQGQIFAELLNWSGLIFTSLVNFILPFIVYIAALREERNRRVGSITTVQPFPPYVRRFSCINATVMALIAVVLVVAAITINLYYIIFEHKNLLG